MLNGKSGDFHPSFLLIQTKLEAPEKSLHVENLLVKDTSRGRSFLQSRTLPLGHSPIPEAECIQGSKA